MTIRETVAVDGKVIGSTDRSPGRFLLETSPKHKLWVTVRDDKNSIDLDHEDRVTGATRSETLVGGSINARKIESKGSNGKLRRIIHVGS